MLSFIFLFCLLIPFQNNKSRKGRRAREGNQHAAHGTVIKVLRVAVGGELREREEVMAAAETTVAAARVRSERTKKTQITSNN
jgi:hypothetical protein